MEADDMVMEGFAFGVPPGSGKALSEHLLHQLQVRLLIKRRIKAQDGSGPFQVIAAELQLCHGVNCTSERGKIHAGRLFEHMLETKVKQAQIVLLLIWSAQKPQCGNATVIVGTHTVAVHLVTQSTSCH